MKISNVVVADFASVTRRGPSRRGAERIMVAMSPSGPATEVLLAGSSTASERGAVWYAVFVATPHNRSQDTGAFGGGVLPSNVKLAEALGAIVVKVSADSEADGLAAFARREGVTDAIVEESEQRRWRRRRRRLIGDAFAKLVPGVAVHVVRRADGTEIGLQRVAPSRGLRRTGVAALMTVTVALLAGFAALTPWPVGLGAALTGAMAWRLWLERHPV